MVGFGHPASGEEIAYFDADLGFSQDAALLTTPNVIDCVIPGETRRFGSLSLEIVILQACVHGLTFE